MQNLTDNPSLVKSANFGDEFMITDLRDNTEYRCSFMLLPRMSLGTDHIPGIENVEGYYLNVQVPADFPHLINSEYSITHVRAVDNKAVLTRSEMFEVISTKQYVIS